MEERLAKPLALDITGTVRDPELPPLSPYSVKYSGYGIVRGKNQFRYRLLGASNSGKADAKADVNRIPKLTLKLTPKMTLNGCRAPI